MATRLALWLRAEHIGTEERADRGSWIGTLKLIALFKPEWIEARHWRIRHTRGTVVFDIE